MGNSTSQARADVPIVDQVTSDAAAAPAQEEIKKQEAAPPAKDNFDPEAGKDKGQDQQTIVQVEETPQETNVATETPQETNVAAEEAVAAEPEEEKKPKYTIADIKTAPRDARFPNVNQTKHCYTRYNEFHKCQKERGEGAPECEKFQRWYYSLCPLEWIERWDEQREAGVFAGPY